MTVSCRRSPHGSRSAWIATRPSRDSAATSSPSCSAPAAGEGECFAVADGLLQALREPFDVAEVTVEIDASVGMARTTPQQPTARLLQAAEAAMNAAKRDHDGVRRYDPAHERGVAGVTLFGELRSGIAADQLRLHYQPQVTVSDGRVRVVEALVRWQHPTRGLLSPAAFIELAERTALIRPLTAQVLRLAARDCRRWRDDGLELTVAVNLSAALLQDERIVRDVLQALAAYRLPPSALQVEITESAPIRDERGALRVLQTLVAHGIGIAIDDFGTGHASLSHLARLPVQIVKIDRSYVQTMDEDPAAGAIVPALLHLAHNLKLRAVAEGVETEEQWSRLQELGCDEAQGFWLARPTPADMLLRTVVDLQSRPVLRSLAEATPLQPQAS